MKTVFVNGEKVAVVDYFDDPLRGDVQVIKFKKPIQKPKTLVEMYEEPNNFSLTTILDAIEHRLQALEAKLEGKS
jgi:hypothetical protein